MNLLDHGYLKIIPEGCWGSDEIIIESARMSTNKGFQGWGPLHDDDCAYEKCPSRDDGVDEQCCQCTCDYNKPGDEKLLRYLYTNRHMTPFEMAGATIEVQAPIFVFREWHRHRTQSYNELSARYTELPDLMYTASHTRLGAGGQSVSNKQGAGTQLDTRTVELADLEIRRAHANARRSYDRLLQLGVSREIARGVIPVNQFSRMRASANLRNWLGFLELRMAPGAQWEIRQYANALHDELKQVFPRTLALFDGD